MSCAIAFAGTEAELHAPGLLWLPRPKLLCAGDIHFEKGSFFSRYGTLLPPYDSDVTLKSLEAAVQRFQPDIFVALGDSFHDLQAPGRMQEPVRQALVALTQRVEEWIWVEGNHDPEVPSSMGGRSFGEFAQGGIAFRHRLDPRAAGWEVSGHYHPKSSTSIKGQIISGPCFVRQEKRLVLPAFGAYTGGLDVDSADFLEVIPQKQRELYLVHREAVYPVRSRRE